MAKDKEEKGLSSKDKGKFIPVSDRAPERKEYQQMSKADVVAAERKHKEDNAQIEKYRSELESPEDDAPEEQTSESATVEKAKKVKKAKK